MTYGFDGLDRPSSILRSGSTTLASFTYNSRGARASIGGNFATSYLYHPDGRLSTLTNSPLASGYTAQYTFGYNPASQIIQQGRDNDAFAWTGAVNGTQSYSTNGLNQYTLCADGRTGARCVCRRCIGCRHLGLLPAKADGVYGGGRDSRFDGNKWVK